MTNHPLLLDLFCGAGGAAMGYHRAGFRVVGVDIKPQPNYPFSFIQMDAFKFAAKWGRGVDFIHASPNCEGYSHLNNIRLIAKHTSDYQREIGKTRKLLQSLGKPYVIENVAGAAAEMQNPVMLCGSMFAGLRVYRHRLFECSFDVLPPAHSRHSDPVPPAGSGVSPKDGYVSITSGGVRNLPKWWDGSGAAYKNMAMGINWMTQAELTKSIPPAFAQYIGAEWLRQNGYDYQYPELKINAKQEALL